MKVGQKNYTKLNEIAWKSLKTKYN